MIVYIMNNFDITKKKCKYYLKKNGKMIYNPFNFYDEYLCLFKGYSKYYFKEFPYLYDKTENEIIKKLLILDIAQKTDIKFINMNTNKLIVKDNKLWFFYDKNKNKVIKIIFLLYLCDKYKIYHNMYLGNNLKKYTTAFMINKVQYPFITNKENLTMIFFQKYINNINEKIIKKYKKSIHDFPNYNELYLFLEKYGYVNIFYEKYAKYITKNYKLLYKILSEHGEYNNFKNEYIKNIQNFKDINLLEIIDKYVSNKFNKKYIKSKFMELSKKI